MQPFTTFEATAAPMLDADIDTDIIFPARFLTLTQKKGLGRCAFHDKRFDAQGDALPDFVLNREPWRAAGILVTGANFGCGSSREQAPWALMDLGIRCVIGPSFGAIFEVNCHRNGLLPVRVGTRDHERLARHAAAAGSIRVDLVARTLDDGGDAPVAFEIRDAIRTALLDGTDEIGRILRDDGARIAAFEERHRRAMPWLHSPHP